MESNVKQIELKPGDVIKIEGVEYKVLEVNEVEETESIKPTTRDEVTNEKGK